MTQRLPTLFYTKSRSKRESHMRYQFSKQLNLWHSPESLIPTPTDLARYLQVNRHNVSLIVKAIAEDFEATVEPVKEILALGYQERRSIAQEEEWDDSFEALMCNPTMDTSGEWATVIHYQSNWDTLREVLNLIGIRPSLEEDFKDKLCDECFNLIQKPESTYPTYSLPSIFSEKAREAVEQLQHQTNDFSEADVIATATPRITTAIGQAIRSKGEVLVLYALIRLLLNYTAY